MAEMDKDRLQKWAYFAEIVSSVAVLITLVFLVFEIRSNSDLIRADSFDRNVASLIDWRMQVVSDDQSLGIMSSHWGVEDPQLLKESLLILSLWSIYEKTYYAQQYDLVGTSEWQRFEYVICVNVQRGPDYWETQIARFLTPEFREYVSQTCQSN